METEVRFREVQEYRQPWLWALLAVRPLLVVVGWLRGNRSRSDVLRELAGFAGVALLLGRTRLTTEVRDDLSASEGSSQAERSGGVYLKFEPFHRSFKRIPFSDLADVRATGYSPLRYGGWGFRWSPRGVAYTVSGKSGVRFERASGKSVFVGSDRPDELLAAVQEATGREV